MSTDRCELGWRGRGVLLLDAQACRTIEGGEPGEPIRSFGRALYFETGDKMSSIETDHISPEKVLQSRINAYVIDAATGQIFLNPPAERSLIRNKQLGMMLGDWLLVEFPADRRASLQKVGAKYQPVITTTKPFEVLVNMRTGKWSIGNSPALTQAINQQQLRDKIMQFYFK